MEHSPAIPTSRQEQLKDVELSQAHREQIRRTVEERIAKFGKRWAQGELEYRKANEEVFTHPGSVERLKVFEQILAEKQEATRKFWGRIRLASVPLFALFATPEGDMRSPIYASHGTYAERALAAEQLAQNGITDFQKQGYLGGISDALSRGLTPFGYYDDNGYNNIPANAWRGITGLVQGTIGNENDSLESGTSATSRQGYTTHINQNRMDAWRLYLGIAQTHGTFGISDYKPSLSKEDVYYYRIENFLKDVQVSSESYFGSDGYKPVQILLALASMDTSEEAQPKNDLEQFLWTSAVSSENPSSRVDSFSGIMGNFTIKTGHDERGDYISYYDRWDLDGSIEGKDGMIGKPFEIYDRIYYDPKTFEPL